jgi:thiamine kinase-like enzyme
MLSRIYTSSCFAFALLIVSGYAFGDINKVKSYSEKHIFKNRSFQEFNHFRVDSKNDIYKATVKEEGEKYFIKDFKDINRFSLELLLVKAIYPANKTFSFIESTNPNKFSAIAYKALKGSLLDEPSLSVDILEKAVNALGRFHKEVAQLDFSAFNLNTQEDKIDRHLREFFNGDQSLVALAHDSLSSIAPENSRIIHNDAHIGNFLIDNYGKVYLIDFESVARGQPMYDFATLLAQVDIPFSDKLSLIEVEAQSQQKEPIKLTIEREFCESIVLRGIFVINYYLRNSSTTFEEAPEKLEEVKNRIKINLQDIRYCLPVISEIRLQEEISKRIEFFRY